ncbi:MAG: Rieske 2Fe-2S domain-containing protein [Pseudobacteriovorax sp.]|nr:Rieske 2Fe-2S domain-containing protein [Pseudobacteriovorax sp.]
MRPRDRCLHRAAQLSKRSLSSCGKVITCPYHGCHFSADGRCIKVPSEGPNGKPYKNSKVESFPVKISHGLVWVWMGSEKQPTTDPFPMPFYGEKGWKHYFMETEFENNVTNLVENFMDVPPYRIRSQRLVSRSRSHSCSNKG